MAEPQLLRQVDGAGLAGFITANTTPTATPLIPEITLHLGSEIAPLWQLTEDELASRGVPPPYWAFAWAGGQALARHVLDHPGQVNGRRVLDLGTGSGLVAIAAALAGAASVLAADIDPFATAACRLNARLNDVAIEATCADVIGSASSAFDMILAGDVCYERALAWRATGWLGDAAASGTDVLIGDPGRAYLPQSRLVRVARYEVPTTRELEDREIRQTGVWRFAE